MPLLLWLPFKTLLQCKVTGTPLVQLKNVNKIYKRKKVVVTALGDINLDLYAGEVVAIVGRSGSGKSTLLNILGSLDKPSSGEVIFEGTRVDKLRDTQLSNHRNLNIGFVFQAYNLMPYLTVAQNIELPLILRGVGVAEREAKALKLAEAVGLGDRLEHIPAELSGGQMQRVAIARALAGNPKMVLADEPTGNLDS
jgi:putative ABC transport system ATP-binding protein